MKILKNSEIDRSKWDQTILNSPTPWVFAQSFYLDATCPGWAALEDGNYKSIMPLTLSKKLGIEYLVQPPFTPQLGIFGTYTAKINNDFFELLKTHYKYIDIELNASNTEHARETKDKRTFVIEAGEKITYNTNTKRNIAKAEKSGLKIGRPEGESAIRLSKKLLNPFLHNKLKLKRTHIRMFENLLENSSAQKKLQTFVVKSSNEKITALAHFISNGQHAVYLKGAAFDRDSGSMHFLMHHAIGFYRNSGVKVFDFGGGQSDSMARFYSGFGATELIYKTYRYNNLPKAIRWLKK